MINNKYKRMIPFLANIVETARTPIVKTLFFNDLKALDLSIPLTRYVTPGIF